VNGFVQRSAPRHWSRAAWLVLVLVGGLSAGCATTAVFTADDTAKVGRLLGLIEERLAVAPQVARVKWNTKAAIDDPPREERVLETAAASAAEAGLDPEVARAFFRGQIEANKVVQRSLHAAWTDQGQPPFEKVADLGTEIRPVLDRLTPELVRAIAETLPILERRGGRDLLEKLVRAMSPPSGSDAALREAVAPLRGLAHE
jgi:chorismate mutase